MNRALCLAVSGLLILSYTTLSFIGQFNGICSDSWICPQVELGLDLKGGTYFALEVGGESAPTFQALPEAEKLEALDDVVAILRDRVDSLGIGEPSITTVSSRRISVQVPGDAQRDRLRNILTQSAKLDFHFLIDFEEADNIPSTKVKDLISGEEYFVSSQSALSGDQIETVKLGVTEFGAPDVQVKLTPEGQTLFSDLTSSKNRDRYVAIVVDKTIMSTLQIGERVTTEWVSIAFSGGDRDVMQAAAKDLVILLRSGSLSYDLQIIEERTVGGTLGAVQIEKGFRALIIALGLIVVFLIIVYRFKGILSVASLLLSLGFIVVALGYMGGVLTLPGLAALILTAGMSVDASILVFERLKERTSNLDFGTLPIVDANITTASAAMVLAYFGNGPIRGFGIVLILGVVGTLLSTFMLLIPILKLKLTKKVA